MHKDHHSYENMLNDFRPEDRRIIEYDYYNHNGDGYECEFNDQIIRVLIDTVFTVIRHRDKEISKIYSMPWIWIMGKEMRGHWCIF